MKEETVSISEKIGIMIDAGSFAAKGTLLCCAVTIPTIAAFALINFQM